LRRIIPAAAVRYLKILSFTNTAEKTVLSVSIIRLSENLPAPQRQLFCSGNEIAAI
jgi:hypothetical protein